MDNSNEDERTVWCGNISDKVSEEVLYELFLQAAPVEKVRIPKDKDGKQNTYGFITFKHQVSVQYATDLLNGTALYDKRLNIKPRTGNLQRQISHHRDLSPISAPQLHSTPQNNMLTALQNLDVLMQMGDHMLINNKLRGNQRDSGYNQNVRSAPYPRWEQSHYRDDRREDNRTNYRRHNHHRNSDRHNSNNYRGSRRYER